MPVDVETYVYASEHNCLLFEVFLMSLKFFLMAGCVFDVP